CHDFILLDFLCFFAFSFEPLASLALSFELPALIFSRHPCQKIFYSLLLNPYSSPPFQLNSFQLQALIFQLLALSFKLPALIFELLLLSASSFSVYLIILSEG
ncbi:MAG: hypothetical protein KAU60_04915, partial [Desulfobacterales bacterium]|nr:hypothetical protein [Desulfobacterales bacterium]